VTRVPARTPVQREERAVLTIHHLGASQSERIIWLCEELEVPYAMIRYERDPATRQAPPEYKALHPSGTAPVIEDGSLMLAESGAIIEYIIARHGGGQLARTSEQPEFADYLFWFHYGSASLLPILIGVMSAPKDGALSAQQGFGERAPRAMDMIERRLSQHEWFAGGEFSAADIMMTLPLNALQKAMAAGAPQRPNIQSYLARVNERPAFRRATLKADPDARRFLL
jgi:glutathione S-transferase